eukprot:CAMPEP_0178392294 /NCGR_PEP_ID=MMETSP0689_2-20121128/11606_1 /TAXON_ID=160604 /ORGANISM="Amphidinium massartii, Strain CS-259" /LENGTH=209 /DNA_ID=CAMNT_0020012867 /DNA_START=481 /DNA_END=1110 /DNA_ORIENTATION=-
MSADVWLLQASKFEFHHLRNNVGLRVPSLNMIFYDMGVPFDDLDNITILRRKAAETLQTFDLIMLTERFDESLVLLKHLLCWQYEDLVYVKFHVAKKARTHGLSAHALSKLQMWLAASIDLYELAVHDFDAKVENMGRTRMSSEQRALQRAQDQLQLDCFSKKKKRRTRGPDGAPCWLYREQEEDFVHYLRQSYQEIEVVDSIVWSPGI